MAIKVISNERTPWVKRDLNCLPAMTLTRDPAPAGRKEKVKLLPWLSF
jgi:hypothetical protein